MDPVTVITLLSLNLIGIGALLVVIGRHLPDTRGLHGFGSGSLAFGAAYLLRLALGFDSAGMAGIAADTCMVFATLCFATGLLQFSGGRPIGRQRVLAVTLAYALIALVATALWQAVGRHAVLNLALASAYMLLGRRAAQASRDQGAALRWPLRVLAGALAVIGLATLARAVAVIIVGTGPLFAGPWAQAYYSFSVVFSTVLGPTLLWIVFVRLAGRLNDMATRDRLTGLLNRHGLAEAMQRHFGGRPPARLVLMLVDVDHFKRINDGHGHAVGDAVLRGVARVLAAQLRGADVVARWGGEEFMVCSHAHSADEAATLAERLRQAVEAAPHRLLDGRPIACTVSVGVSHPFDDRAAWEPSARAADQALYEAKRLGRNRVSMAAALPRQEQPSAHASDRDGLAATAAA